MLVQVEQHLLDLGCGTGLVGETFKDLAEGAGRLDGIDLAPRMLDVARARGIYHELILGDLESVLFSPGRSYDLIVSADTMIYLGDLKPAFTGVAKRLEPGGFYIFACEAKAGTGSGLLNLDNDDPTARRLREAYECHRIDWTDLVAWNAVPFPTVRRSSSAAERQEGVPWI